MVRMPSEVACSSIIDDLDDEQREAVLAARGPVCVLAGAGTGKTRTITRRIAHLVSSGHVAPGQVLAVTFTHGPPVRCAPGCAPSTTGWAPRRCRR